MNLLPHEAELLRRLNETHEEWCRHLRSGSSRAAKEAREAAYQKFKAAARAWKSELESAGFFR